MPRMALTDKQKALIDAKLECLRRFRELSDRYRDDPLFKLVVPILVDDLRLYVAEPFARQWGCSFGVSRSVLYKWDALERAGGPEALLDSRGGDQRSDVAADRQVARQAVMETRPEHLRHLPQPNWFGRLRRKRARRQKTA